MKKSILITTIVLGFIMASKTYAANAHMMKIAFSKDDRLCKPMLKDINVFAYFQRSGIGISSEVPSHKSDFYDLGVYLGSDKLLSFDVNGDGKKELVKFSYDHHSYIPKGELNEQAAGTREAVHILHGRESLPAKIYENPFLKKLPELKIYFDKKDKLTGGNVCFDMDTFSPNSVPLPIAVQDRHMRAMLYKTKFVILADNGDCGGCFGDKMQVITIGKDYTIHQLCGFVDVRKK